MLNQTFNKVETSWINDLVIYSRWLMKQIREVIENTPISIKEITKLINLEK